MNNYVPGCGKSTAKLFVCGEAPGGREVETGLPFSGPSGELLWDALDPLTRNNVYTTNVCKVRPPDNDIKKLNLIGHSIEEFIPQLVEEINAINPNCILAVGGTALKVLTGYDGIEKYRGSILRCQLTGHKVVAAMHPAGLLHGTTTGGIKNWKEYQYIVADCKRAIAQSEFPEIRNPERTLEIGRDSLQFLRFLERYNGHKVATIDVETFKCIPICFGIAFNSWNAMSVPTFTTKDVPITRPEMVYIWKLLAEFLGDNKTKLVAQNGKFDTKRSREIGLRWANLWYDVMLAWHTLYSELGKKLQIISSILTEEPYYKDEYKEYNPKMDKFDRILLYNAKDAVVEYECYEKTYKLLEEENLLDFFFERVMPLHQVYSDMEDVGLKVDEEIRAALKKKYTENWRSKKANLIELIINGQEDLRESFSKFNVNSPKQVAKLLYGFLSLPPRKDTGEDTLKALANNNTKDIRKQQIIRYILEGRKITKTIGTYLEAKCSADERLHSEFMIVGTETGRTSTQQRKPPVSVSAEGLAFQTMTKHEDVTLDAGGGDLRAMYVADEDYVFIEPDLSQAEDRVVCVLSEDWDALKSYDKKDWKYNRFGLKDDRHTTTAMMVCEKRFDDIQDFDRQIGKRVRHAGNYNMGKHQGMLTLARYGVFVSEWRMGKYLDLFHSSNSNIRGVFHANIQKCLAENDCRMYNPFGRLRVFFNKWGDELFKEAYANIPQSTVSDQVKFAMVRLANRKLGKFFFVSESHDSFLALVHKSIVDRVLPIIKEEMEQPINFSKCSLSYDFNLVIPCEIKMGTRWIDKSDEFPDGMKKVKI